MRKRAWMYHIPFWVFLHVRDGEPIQLFEEFNNAVHKCALMYYDFDRAKLASIGSLDCIVLSVVLSDVEIIKLFLCQGGRKQFIQKNLATLIDCAIDCNSSPETKLLLLDYQNENGLYRERKFQL